MANAGTDPTALLKVLIEADAVGVEVTRRDDRLEFDNWSRATPELRRLAKQAQFALAPMMVEQRRAPGGRA